MPTILIIPPGLAVPNHEVRVTGPLRCGEDRDAGVVELLRELDAAAAEIRRLTAAQTQFLSTVSHDVRTPLYAARGLLEELAMADGLDEQGRADVEMLSGTVEETLSVVDVQLDLARTEAARTVVRVGPARADALFARLGGTLRTLRRSDDVLLTLAVADSVPELQTDASRLTRLVRDLVARALTDTDHGTVDVTADAVDDGRRVRFTVADTGSGLPGEDRPWVRRDVAVLGGTLEITATPGRGSTATVTIPVDYVAPNLDGLEVETA